MAKITIDLPDAMPANFEDPSQELLSFMTQFTDACVRLTRRYQDIDGRTLFSAFVRDGANSVLCTDSLESRPIQRNRDIPEQVEDFSEELHAPPPNSVFMDDDLPGAWVVARLNIQELGYVTLRSCRFRSGLLGEPSIAAELIQFVVRWLDFQLHTVPGSG